MLNLAGPDKRRRADRARQVADILRRQILHGDLRHTLPREQTLVAEFSTTRNTVREALELLRQEGLVERCPGVGTVVRGRKHLHGLERLQGLGETFAGRGVIHNEVRVLTVVKPPTAVSDRLLLSEDDDVVYLERLRRLDGEPVSLDVTYLVPDLGQQLLALDLRTQDVFALLEEISGRPLGHAELGLEAVNADAHTAVVLGIATGAALLMLERLTHQDDGRPIDLEFIRFRGDRLSLRGTTHRQQFAATPPSKEIR